VSGGIKPFLKGWPAYPRSSSLITYENEPDGQSAELNSGIFGTGPKPLSFSSISVGAFETMTHFITAVVEGISRKA
jgi:hypothetical protein